MLSAHGGNIRKIMNLYGIPRNKLIDFSSSINPLGANRRINSLIKRNSSVITDYPDPECILLRRALADYTGVAKENVLTGNGSNELIHLVPRALNCASALICNPTFSEYALSLKLASARTYFLNSREENAFSCEIKKISGYVKKVDLIILCNPNNPTGNILKKEELLELAAYCRKNKTYLFIDEVFMEFVDNQERFSLKNEIVKNSYLLILRSLTKFFSLAGLRIGYLLAHKRLVKKISLFQPAWSVNALAQEIAVERLSDSNFILKSQEFIKRERDFLFNRLKEIRGIYPYPAKANFIFCKILGERLNSKSLFSRLMKSGIIIRDCSNFYGLDNRFFRVAVKSRKDNLYLVSRLRESFK